MVNLLFVGGENISQTRVDVLSACSAVALILFANKKHVYGERSLSLIAWHKSMAEDS